MSYNCLSDNIFELLVSYNFFDTNEIVLEDAQGARIAGGAVNPIQDVYVRPRSVKHKFSEKTEAALEDAECARVAGGAVDLVCQPGVRVGRVPRVQTRQVPGDGALQEQEQPPAQPLQRAERGFLRNAACKGSWRQNRARVQSPGRSRNRNSPRLRPCGKGQRVQLLLQSKVRAVEGPHYWRTTALGLQPQFLLGRSLPQSSRACGLLVITPCKAAAKMQSEQSDPPPPAGVAVARLPP